ncbi:LOW QUALITY PROTEIN: PITH domain-containing protein 1-like [Bolinopsis microptera]|uniref:LOW QUALITY PROTEIN: PITH domain-containing protein 1-like n=1 Tax=Bolinopsis microptera TaxID=2820187 RepID=UPI0030792AEA
MEHTLSLKALSIDFQTLDCLNETVEGAGTSVFKPWDLRKDKSKLVESDLDEELLFNFSFTGSVKLKLKGIIVIGGGGESDPSHLKVFKNAVPVSFDDAGRHAEQEFDLQHDKDGVVEYQTKVARFNNCDSLSLYFDKNFGADETKICHIGLRGDFSEAQKRGVVICTYESSAQLKDHKTPGASDYSAHGVS